MAIFVFWNMKGYFDSIPEAIEDAARIDGVNDRQLITKIVMPLARPSIIISSVLVVIYVWNEYIFSTVFLSGAEKNTLAVALYSLQATDYTRNWPLFSAAAILTTLPVLILFFLVQKYMERIAGNAFNTSKIYKVLFRPTNRILENTYAAGTATSIVSRTVSALSKRLFANHLPKGLSVRIVI